MMVESFPWEGRVAWNIPVSFCFQGQSTGFSNESTLVIITRVRFPSPAPLKSRGLSQPLGFGTVLTQFGGWVHRKPGLRSLLNSLPDLLVPPLLSSRNPRISRERVRPGGSPPHSPKMDYEPVSPEQREKTNRRNF